MIELSEDEVVLLNGALAKLRESIDDKPQIIDVDNKGAYYGVHENVVYYTDTKENDIKQVNKLGIVQYMNKLPDVGNFDKLYYVNNIVYYGDGTAYKELVFINEDKESKLVSPIKYYSRDWRTELYLQGLEAENNGVDTGYYYQELNAFWPLEYCLDPNNQHFFGEDDKIIRYGLTEGNYFLDFIDANSAALGEYSI